MARLTAAQIAAAKAAETQNLDLNQILLGQAVKTLDLVAMTAKGNPVFANPDNEEQEAPISLGLLKHYITEGQITNDGATITCEAGFKFAKGTWQPVRKWDNADL